jgi:DNA-binding Lrp family transcriptional regulator
MPQITCPNCGTTISLENRREVDFALIRNATDRRPRTFTELVNITKLSRKTLNIRLKELCAEGILTKEEGMYKSNGASGFGNNGGHVMKGLSRVFDDKRMRTGLMLIALLTAFSVSGYVLATIVVPFTYVEPQAAPKPIGNFTMALVVSNVSDLYAWQAAITFNSTQISVAEAQSGDLMKGEFPLFSISTDTSNGLLLLTETLEGNVNGKTGSGTLATITFEYYVNKYQLPSLASQNAVFGTWLEDSTLTTIPSGQTLLTLNVIG